MPDDEGFRRYLQAGMAWFSVTQQKAEGILRDLTDSGEAAMGQAQKMFDRIVDRGREGSEELRDLVQAEIREQVAALGLATKDDIARLEAKLDAVQATPPPAPPKAAAPAKKAARKPTVAGKRAVTETTAGGGTGATAARKAARGARAPGPPERSSPEKA